MRLAALETIMKKRGNDVTNVLCLVLVSEFPTVIIQARKNNRIIYSENCVSQRSQTNRGQS